MSKKNVEPSDIIRLLEELGRTDPTCHQFRALAHREPILTVCYAAIEILAAQKAEMFKKALDLACLSPPKPMIVSQEEAERVGSKRAEQ